MVLSKNYDNSDGSRSHPNVLSYLWLVLYKKVKMKTQNSIASSDHSKVRSTQEKRALFFSWLGHGV